MSTSKISVTEGSGKNLATNSISEDAVTKEISRVVINDSSGVEANIDTSDVTVSSSALPTGAATSAKQDTGNTSLASIDTKTPALGQALAAASVPVVLTAAQLSTLTPPAAITGFLTESDFDTKVGALTETAPATDTASSGLNGRLQRIAQRLSSIIALLPTALGAGGGLKIDGSGTDLPVSASSLPLPTGASTSAKQDTQITSLQLIDDTIFTDDAAFTPGTSKVSVVGFLSDEISTDSVDEGDTGAARMTLDRKQIVTVQPHTTGGWSVGNFTTGDTYTALTNTAQVIKGSAGSFGGYYIYNPNTSATYVMVYNVAAASVTVGTTTALLVFCIPAGSAANLELIAGIPFDTAMSIAAATTGGGNTAPSTALEAMIFYK
jgi:hypothetical protein